MIKSKKTLRHSAQFNRMKRGYIFCIPLIFGLLFMFIPNLVQSAIFTLNNVQTTDQGYELSWIGIENYVKAFNNGVFLVNLKSSLVSLFTGLPVITIFSLFIAVVLNQKFRGRGFVRTVFFVPVLLATGVVASVEDTSELMGVIVNNPLDTGLDMDLSQVEGIKNILTGLNFNDTLINIVTGAADGIYNIVQSSGIQIMILLAGLQEISPSLYEAAQVEGCDSWSLFWKITFPVISPQLVVCALYTIVDSYTSVTNTLVPYVQQAIFGSNQLGYATAMYYIYFAFVGVLIAVVGAIVRKFVHYEND